MAAKTGQISCSRRRAIDLYLKHLALAQSDTQEILKTRHKSLS